MGSVFSKTNEDNTDRVTNTYININCNCFNGKPCASDTKKPVNGEKKIKSN